MVGLGSAANTVHAVGDTLEETRVRQPGDGAPADSGVPRLRQRDQPPLAFGEIADAQERAWHAANYTVSNVYRSSDPDDDQQRRSVDLDASWTEMGAACSICGTVERVEAAWRGSAVPEVRGGDGATWTAAGGGDGPEREGVMGAATVARERAGDGVAYRERVLAVEPHGIEPIAGRERHGRVRSLFTLWWSANMGLPVWLVGALAVAFGLGFPDAVAAILVGNLVGCALLGLAASMGPATGMPQLPFSRRSFGARAVYLPALLNWVSASGWYAVNSVLGAAALARLAGWPFLPALALLTAGQMALGVFGYNFIHRFEAVSAVLLGVVFAVMTAIGVPQAHLDLTSHLAPADHAGLFVLMATAVASYVFSWAPYASDYSRYLPAETPRGRVFGAVFAGAFLGCAWLQVLGAAVATVGLKLEPIDLVVRVMGGFWVPALLAVVLGTLAANALNIYTGALSLLTLDVPIRRWVSVLAVGVLGGLLALYGAQGLSAKYEQFLLLISYWIGPWLAVVAVDFFRRRGARTDGSPAIGAGLVPFLVGLAASIPFMNSALYEGPLARRLHGADIAYYVGMVVAGVLYLALIRRAGRPADQTG